MIEKVLSQLLAAFWHVRTIRDMKFFLEAIFSPKELAQIPKRLEVLRRIGKGEFHRNISKELNVSISTVTRASNIYKFLQKENSRWWVEFKKRKGIPTEEYKDIFAEMGVFIDSNEKRKWMRRFEPKKES